MTYGEKGRRTKPRVNVLRGYGGNEPVSLTYSAKPKLAEAILSGMVISIDVNGEWVKGATAGKVPFIAYHDQADTDVDSSGLLLGLSCAGDFEIETGYFDSTDTYARDDVLIAGTAGLLGSLDKGVALLGETIANGAALLDVVGYVTKGKQQVQAGTKTIPSYATTTTAFDPAKNINTQFTVGANANANSTLTFMTRWTGARKAIAAA
jgi:hypothetical protein